MQSAEDVARSLKGGSLSAGGQPRAEPEARSVVDLRDPAGGGEGARVPSQSLSLGGYVVLLVTADACAAELSVLLALMLRFNGNVGTINGISYLALAPGFLVGWLLTMWFGGTYDKRILVSGPEEFRRVLNGAVWMLAAIAVVGFVAHVEVSRGVIALSLPAATLLSLGCRYAARRRIQSRLTRGNATLYRAVVVGTQEEADSLANHMRRNAHVGFVVSAVYRPPRRGRTMGERVAELLALAERTGADTLAVAGTSGFGSAQLRRLAWALEGTGIRLLMVPALTDLAGPRISVQPIDGLPLLHIEEPDFAGPKLVFKRCVDLVGGMVLTIICSPVLLAIILAVYVSDGRPVLYSQVRVGRHGELFRMFKFRTMVRNADDLAEELPEEPETTPVRPKPEQDPRVTRVGRVLRRHSLDELPQLINVLAGDMALVGPRPHRPFEVADYGDDDRRRLLIKPGVTGLWQVSGRAALPWDEAVRLDLHYVENWSIWLDALLILKTLRAVLFPQGAY